MLLQKSVNYGQKRFITLAPGGHSYDLYLNVVHFLSTSVNKTSVAAYDNCFPA
jgi:hypothetical protein